MRTAKHWLIVGVVVLALGLLPLLSGLPRSLAIVAGVPVVLISVVRLLSHESDYSKEAPRPTGSESGGYGGYDGGGYDGGGYDGGGGT